MGRPSRSEERTRQGNPEEGQGLRQGCWKVQAGSQAQGTQEEEGQEGQEGQEAKGQEGQEAQGQEGKEACRQEGQKARQEGCKEGRTQEEVNSRRHFFSLTHPSTN